MQQQQSKKRLLDVQDLRVYFPVYGGVLRREVARIYAVDGVSFELDAGKTLGLVGESGCGKTTLGRAILRLYEPSSGRILFEGQDFLAARGEHKKSLQKKMQMIFQDPYGSLNSRHTVGYILEEPLKVHKVAPDRQERKKRVLQLLDCVGLPASSFNKFPHEFSGGQRQRIGIARALSLDPKLIICDEPVSALDVSVQAQVINLLLDLQKNLGLSYLFISHDLSVVRHVSDRVAVMYLGNIVEYATPQAIYQQPKHPYTQALIAGIPKIDGPKKKTFPQLQGEIPSPMHRTQGCHFHPRCPYAVEKCRHQEPQLKQVDQDTYVRCHLFEEKAFR